MNHARRRIPPQELGDGEPASDGLEFFEALDLWIAAPDDDQWAILCRKIFGEDEVAPRVVIDRVLRDWKISEFKRRWELGEFVAFAYPLHDNRASRRIVVSAALREVLYFLHPSRWDRGGDATDGYTLKRRQDGDFDIGVLPQHRRRRFRNLLFYRTSLPAGPRGTYGQKSKMAKEWIIGYRAEIERLPSLTQRAQLVAQATGCSKSLAKNALRDEGF